MNTTSKQWRQDIHNTWLPSDSTNTHCRNLATSLLTFCRVLLAAAAPWVSLHTRNRNMDTPSSLTLGKNSCIWGIPLRSTAMSSKLVISPGHSSSNEWQGPREVQLQQPLLLEMAPAIPRAWHAYQSTTLDATALWCLQKTRLWLTWWSKHCGKEPVKTERKTINCDYYLHLPPLHRMRWWLRLNT